MCEQPDIKQRFYVPVFSGRFATKTKDFLWPSDFRDAENKDRIAIFENKNSINYKTWNI